MTRHSVPLSPLLLISFDVLPINVLHTCPRVRVAATVRMFFLRLVVFLILCGLLGCFGRFLHTEGVFAGL